MEHFTGFYWRGSAITCAAVLAGGAAFTAHATSVAYIACVGCLSMLHVALNCLGVRTLGTGRRALSIPLAFMLLPLASAFACMAIPLAAKGYLKPATLLFCMMALFAPSAVSLAFALLTGIRSLVKSPGARPI
jgi:hypothetical protein